MSRAKWPLRAVGDDGDDGDAGDDSDAGDDGDVQGGGGAAKTGIPPKGNKLKLHHITCNMLYDVTYMIYPLEAGARIGPMRGKGGAPFCVRAVGAHLSRTRPLDDLA